MVVLPITLTTYGLHVGVNTRDVALSLMRGAVHLGVLERSSLFPPCSAQADRFHRA